MYACPERRALRIDGDADGQISESEFQARPRSLPHLSRFMSNYY